MERRGFVEHFVSNRIKKNGFVSKMTPHVFWFLSRHTHTHSFFSLDAHFPHPHIVVCTPTRSFSHPRIQLIKLLKKAPPNASSSSSPANGLIPGSLSKGSVIVYVWKKFETEIVAEQLTQADIDGGGLCFITVGWRTGSARHHRASSWEAKLGFVLPL